MLVRRINDNDFTGAVCIKTIGAANINVGEFRWRIYFSRIEDGRLDGKFIFSMYYRFDNEIPAIYERSIQYIHVI